MPLENLQLLLLGGIGHANLQQKSVQLRLGQRISAFEVHRVLRGEDGEPGGQRAAHAVGGHLALFHAFQQRGLGARRHAVDLVHQQQVGEHRPGVEGEDSRNPAAESWCPECRRASGRAWPARAGSRGPAAGRELSPSASWRCPARLPAARGPGRARRSAPPRSPRPWPEITRPNLGAGVRDQLAGGVQALRALAFWFGSCIGS